ncbi:MAG: hypothetical protein QM486_01875 [Flavobacteriaceae bacterium]
MGCSKEFTTISPVSISFVHADGTAILEGECIKPDIDYAILVETTTSGVGETKMLRVDYTFNGDLKTMTFLNGEKQLNPVKLINGTNTAQIVGSDKISHITFIDQGDFELVE